MTMHVKGHRFGFRITQFSQLLMMPFGVTRSRAYAQVQDGKLHVRFGPMFDEKIPLESIKEVEVSRWPRWAGVGPRANFRGTVGLVGSYGDVVRLTLKEPMDAHLFLLPVSFRRLYMSLEHPEGFLEEVGKAPAVQHRAKRAA